MTSHTTMPTVSRLEVIATGARRRWSLEEKQRIVAESFALARNVSATARRHGLSGGQLFMWRRLAREGKLVLNGNVGGFVPAIITSQERAHEPSPNSASATLSCDLTPPGGRIEIVLVHGDRVIVGGDVDAAALARVIKALSRR